VTHPGFRITQRHYNLIIRQGYDNLPQESGGFLGGKDFLIQAVLPTANQHLYNRTETFGLTSDDMSRSHVFFAKHNLEYYGVYHTHPKGIAYPSPQDISTGQKYHFIISYANDKQPELAVYEIFGLHPVRVPLTVIDNKGFQALDLQGTGKSDLKTQTLIKPELARDPDSEAQRLSRLIQDIKYDQVKYPRLSSLRDGSDFSTLA